MILNANIQPLLNKQTKTRKGTASAFAPAPIIISYLFKLVSLPWLIVSGEEDSAAQETVPLIFAA